MRFGNWSKCKVRQRPPPVIWNCFPIFRQLSMNGEQMQARSFVSIVQLWTRRTFKCHDSFYWCLLYLITWCHSVRDSLQSQWALKLAQSWKTSFLWQKSGKKNLSIKKLVFNACIDNKQNCTRSNLFSGRTGLILFAASFTHFLFHTFFVVVISYFPTFLLDSTTMCSWLESGA